MDMDSGKSLGTTRLLVEGVDRLIINDLGVYILLIIKWGCFVDASLIADDLAVPVRDLLIPVAA